MPSIKDKSTVEAIARAFTSNGRNKEKALKAVGYSDNYAEHRAECVLGNVGVIEAISRIDAKQGEEQGWDVKIAKKKLLDVVEKAINLNQPSAAVSGLVAINRMFALDKDNQVNTEQPTILSPAEFEEAKEMAQVIIRNRLKISKEA